MSLSSRHLSARWSFLTILLFVSGSISHCGWTPEVKTNIYEGPEGSVALETVSAETFPNSHPVDLSPTQLSRAMSGVHLSAHKGLFQTILTGEETPERLFSDQAVTFLEPLILTALAKATAEEHVTFSLPVKGGGHIAGNVIYLEPTLFLTITKLPTSSKMLPKGGGAFARFESFRRSPIHPCIFPSCSGAQRLFATVAYGTNFVPACRNTFARLRLNKRGQRPNPTLSHLSSPPDKPTTGT